jgi:hypothetical protein
MTADLKNRSAVAFSCYLHHQPALGLVQQQQTSPRFDDIRHLAD